MITEGRYSTEQYYVIADLLMAHQHDFSMDMLRKLTPDLSIKDMKIRIAQLYIDKIKSEE